MKRLANDVVSETVKPAVEFIKKVKPEHKVAVIHGHDCDSICSAAIMSKLIKSYCKADVRLLASKYNYSVDFKTVEEVEKFKANHVIIVDIATVHVDVLHELKLDSFVLIIDHHVPKGYTGVVYCNPRIYNNVIYLPTSYLAYKIYEMLLKPKEVLWIAGLGVLADKGMKNCDDLYRSIKLCHPELIGKIENDDGELFDNSLLGKLVKVTDSGRIVKDVNGAIMSLNALLTARNYNDILNNKDMLKLHEIAEKEFSRLVKDLGKNKKELKGMILYEIKSKFNFKSSLASYLTRLFDDKVIVIYQKNGGVIDVSFRRGKGSEIDLNLLATAAVDNIPNSSGGGHPTAAGAGIPAKYLSKFIDNLKNMV